MTPRQWLVLPGSLVVSFAFAACSSARPDEMHIVTISNDTQEPVPCAIFIDGELQKDASGELVKTPASIAVVFKGDPTGAHTSQGVILAVYPLMSEGGATRLPQEESNEFPPYRFDRFAQRLVRNSDARSQLFILLTNNDRKAFAYPRRGATLNAGN